MKRNTIKALASIVFILSTLSLHAQKRNELSFHLRNGILLNNGGVSIVSGTGSGAFSKAANTFQQSIGAQYTYVTKPGILVSAGLDLGYEQYKTTINFPFAAYGYIQPTTKLDDHYKPSGFIPYMQLQVNLGYRLPRLGKLRPEIRLGEILRIPLGSKYFDNSYTALAQSQVSRDNLSLLGSYGKIGGSFAGEFIEHVYVGTQLPPIIKGLGNCSIGIQYQQQFQKFNELNYLSVRYFDASGTQQRHESFIGRHRALSLVLGVSL